MSYDSAVEPDEASFGPFTAKTGVRVPLGAPWKSSSYEIKFHVAVAVKKCRASSHIVAHPHEIKSFGRGDHAAAAAVARVERGAQIGGVPFAGADMFERAGDRAHLGMQKRSRAYADLNFFADPHDIETFQRAHRAVRLALGRAKSREVMAPNEMPRRRLHGAVIELSLDEPGMAPPHR